MVLHRGKIAEMKTGEGKTLVATLPAVLNALTGRGVHVVTVNDYLARRDAEWMGRIYTFLGLTVGVVVHGVSDPDRKAAYACDITYGQNNEFGFDYLRDNMKFNLEDYVQREHNFAIVDEVDSILIDEARTPLIISGASEESTDTYYVVDRVIPRLKLEEHYTIDEKLRTVALTEEGVTKVEQLLGIDNLYDPRNILLVHHVNQALKAHTLFKRDVEYVVKDGQVVIVDEFTGRLMPGRRWSDGLHQAVEAKEGVKIESENQTLATITFQNYFRMYDKLAGMTGTADTEAVEFKEIYGLDVMVVPTNQPMIRIDNHDVVYKTEDEKFDAVIEEIQDCHERGQPVLVGTVSIEKSERVANQLKKTGVKHSVLNAKNHEREAEIVAQAGRFGGGHDFDQHGRPRHRYRARRQPRVHGRGRGRHARPQRRKVSRGAREVSRPMPGRARAGARGRRPAHPRHRAPRVAAHRQPVARAFGTPGRPRQLAVFPLARRRPAAHLRRRPAQGPDGPDRDGGRRPDRASMDHARRSRTRRRRSRRTTSTSASICSNTTT